MSSSRAFQPRIRLVLAEQPVDFPGLYDHVTEARTRVELALRGQALRYATAIDLNEGMGSIQSITAFERALFVNLISTLLYGHQSVIDELRQLRSLRDDTPSLIAEEAEEVRSPEAAAPHLRRITMQATGRFQGRMGQAWAALRGEETTRGDALRDRALRAAHVTAIENVSVALNTGRSLAAMGRSSARVILADRAAPALYAMRSEQLDRNTCNPCDSLHGTLAEVGTDRYFMLLPPAGCVTASIEAIGPRCRGVMVYGDSLDDFLGGSI